ncbi:PREDICTED: transcription initiation factor TFIID subunit 4-like [Sturnus vulgaris]|uniref:transcription initiation factor TFIID subunit 4-like n=1 Tax=Sturnus vulgaris TaxID=9172 RepID=UPI00071A44C5|nr:PREDICTED: transcription initiation factor TFIID subunit 4-like [Sturnus vulgaris]
MALLCSSSQHHTHISDHRRQQPGSGSYSSVSASLAAGKAATSLSRQLTEEEGARRAETPSPPPAGYLGSGRALRRRMLPAGASDNGAQTPAPTPADPRETPARAGAAGPCVPAAARGSTGIPGGAAKGCPRHRRPQREPRAETATRPAPSPAPPCTFSRPGPRALPPAVPPLPHRAGAEAAGGPALAHGAAGRGGRGPRRHRPHAPPASVPPDSCCCSRLLPRPRQALGIERSSRYSQTGSQITVTKSVGWKRPLRSSSPTFDRAPLSTRPWQ